MLKSKPRAERILVGAGVVWLCGVDPWVARGVGKARPKGEGIPSMDDPRVPSPRRPPLPPLLQTGIIEEIIILCMLLLPSGTEAALCFVFAI